MVYLKKHSPELIYARQKISNYKHLTPLHYVFSAGLLWYISLCIGRVSKCAKVWARVEESEI